MKIKTLCFALIVSSLMSAHDSSASRTRPQQTPYGEDQPEFPPVKSYIIPPYEEETDPVIVSKEDISQKDIDPNVRDIVDSKKVQSMKERSTPPPCRLGTNEDVWDLLGTTIEINYGTYRVTFSVNSLGRFSNFQIVPR